MWFKNTKHFLSDMAEHGGIYASQSKYLLFNFLVYEFALLFIVNEVNEVNIGKDSLKQKKKAWEVFKTHS